MPSNRKRIGFLPSEEVHKLIEKLSLENKCSQSKITGILVEEALKCRGNDNYNKKNNIIDDVSKKHSRNNNNFTYTNNNFIDNFEFSLIDENYLKDELKMINQFIEFKLFKAAMRKSSDILND